MCGEIIKNNITESVGSPFVFAELWRKITQRSSDSSVSETLPTLYVNITVNR